MLNHILRKAGPAAMLAAGLLLHAPVSAADFRDVDGERDGDWRCLFYYGPALCKETCACQGMFGGRICTTTYYYWIDCGQEDPPEVCNNGGDPEMFIMGEGGDCDCEEAPEANGGNGEWECVIKELPPPNGGANGG